MNKPITSNNLDAGQQAVVNSIDGNIIKYDIYTFMYTYT